MACATEKDRRLNQATSLFVKHGFRANRKGHHHALKLLILIVIILFGTIALSGKTPNIRGVQIEFDDGNRICMSFEGEITGIILNGTVNFPGKTFCNITKVGDTEISRNHSGILTRIGRSEISRDQLGDIIKIGNASVVRDKAGTVIAVDGDPNVSPLFETGLP